MRSYLLLFCRVDLIKPSLVSQDQFSGATF